MKICISNISIKRYHKNSAIKRNSSYDIALSELENSLADIESVEEKYEVKELARAISDFLDITDNDWNNMLQTNLTSMFYTIQETLPNMIHNKSGCIINISSIWGMVGASCEVHYSVSKAGVDGLTKSVAKELGPSNIRVNSVAPGIIETDMTSDYTAKELQDIKNQIPLEKIGKPEDIAKCVGWLVDDCYVTGQVISPNGGWVI